MHPVLLSLDLSAWHVPLLPWLSLLTVALAAVALSGWQARRLDLALAGTAAAATVATAAVVLRHHVYVPSSLVFTSFGVLLGAALLVGWRMTLSLASHDGMASERVSGTLFVALLVGFVGARLAYTAANFDSAQGAVQVLDLRAGGLIGFVGLLAALAAVIARSRDSHAEWRRLADAAAPNVAMGAAAVHLGDYLLGSSFGQLLGPEAPSWLQAAGTFPRWPGDVLGGAGSPPWSHQVELGLVEAQSRESLPLHPTQLYLFLGTLLLVPIVFQSWKLKRFHGHPFLVLAIGYGAVRFVLDSWRGDPQRWLVSSDLPRSWVLGIGASILAFAVVLGPLRSVSQLAWRRAAWGATLLAPLVLLAAAMAEPGAVHLSLSQCAGFLGALWAAALWRQWEDPRIWNAKTERPISSR
jgi:phosphatidylglycerol:prolipoprotein diacylglycerol transferase